MKWCACSWQNHLQSTIHSYGISESRMSNQNLPQVLVGTAAKEIACRKWCVLFRNQSLHSSFLTSHVRFCHPDNWAYITSQHKLLGEQSSCQHSASRKSQAPIYWAESRSRWRCRHCWLASITGKSRNHADRRMFLTFDERSSYFLIVKNECKCVKLILNSYLLSVCSKHWIISWRQDGLSNNIVLFCGTCR